MAELSDVVVLFGGASEERLVSVATAQQLAQVVPEAELLFWGADGAVRGCEREALVAHERPFERELELEGEPAWSSLEAALDDARLRERTFFIALHGGAGEDGRVQEALERRGFAFTGSGSLASRRAMDKLAAKEIARRRSIQTAPAIALPTNDPGLLRRRLESFVVTHGGAIVKPVADGSSVGLVVVRGARDVPRTVEAIVAGPPGARMVEAFVDGRELTVGVVDEERGPRALPPSEVSVVPGGTFDYAGKYLGRGALETTPARVPSYVAHAAQAVALTMHRALGCEGYSRTDVIVTGRGTVFLETNTLPGLTSASFVPQQLAAEGTTMRSFVEGQLVLARRRRDSKRRAA